MPVDKSGNRVNEKQNGKLDVSYLTNLQNVLNSKSIINSVNPPYHKYIRENFFTFKKKKNICTEKVVLTKRQIHDLIFDGEFYVTTDQHNILKKYEGEDKWNYIHKGWKIRNYILGYYENDSCDDERDSDDDDEVDCEKNMSMPHTTKELKNEILMKNNKEHAFEVLYETLLNYDRRLNKKK
jgi:hypothetical protein